MSERDDKLLAEHMAKLHQDNEEVSGDEDSEEEEDTGMGEVDVENSSSGFMDWKVQCSLIFLFPFFFFFGSLRQFLNHCMVGAVFRV